MTDPLPFVREVLHLHEVGSTNERARELAPTIEPGQLPFLILADRQTAGRGRGSNVWWSDSGSLTFTVLLDPSSIGLHPDQEPRTALATGLAVLTAVSPFLGDATIGIRWPNDVEVDGRKIAGILVERIAGPRLIIGVGINVSTRYDGAPADVTRMATSLADHAPHFYEQDDRLLILSRFLAALADELNFLASDDPGQVERLNASDLLANNPVRIDQGIKTFEGLGRGIAADGALLVESGGHLFRFVGGRVIRP